MRMSEVDPPNVLDYCITGAAAHIVGMAFGLAWIDLPCIFAVAAVDFVGSLVGKHSIPLYAQAHILAQRPGSTRSGVSHQRRPGQP